MAKKFSDISIEEILPFIDWKPFFQAWELHGNFPQILDDKKISNKDVEELRLANHKDHVELFWIGHQG